MPLGIATDDTTKNFFARLVKEKSLARLVGFENEAFIFPSVHNAFRFCTLTFTGVSVQTERPIFNFFCRYYSHIEDKQRQFLMSENDIEGINPNTLTCPIFRTGSDAEIVKRIYKNNPVIENEALAQNHWLISFFRMFDMANDSNLFKGKQENGTVPLYEAKLFHQFDHRFSTYANASQADLNSGRLPQVSSQDKKNITFNVQTNYWVSQTDVDIRLKGRWDKKWLIAFRRICPSTNERTAIFSILPKVACSDSVFLMMPGLNNNLLICCLFGNCNSIVFDFVTRQKIGGSNLSFFIVKQLPVIPPHCYSRTDIDFIAPRVLELTYTAWSLQPFAQDMGYHSDPFIWNPERRAHLRAELDAYYAHLYGLTRDELRYILDPADIHGPDFPSETFRVLKNNEIKQFGEYRTQRLVLEAWDQLFGAK